VAVEIVGLRELLLKMRAITRAVAAQTAADAVVGFSAPYAIHVHEDLRARHRTGRAKFLEIPARQLGRQIGREIGVQAGAGVPIDRALLNGAIRIMVAAQALCPVRTGYLRSSAYAELRGGAA
jgi:hypothetical protein